MVEFKPVMFKLGDELYGIDINLVQSIEKEQQIVRVPNADPQIKGIINLRGVVIPVFSLRKKFGMEDKDSKEQQYVIVNIKGTSIAIEVDGVDEIKNVDETMVHGVPVIINNGKTDYFEKVINLDGKLVVIINIDNLLSIEEMKNVEELASKE